MTYRVQVTHEAARDIEEALAYIEDMLCNARAAQALYAQVEKVILGLDMFPQRYPLCRDVVLEAYGVRYVHVKKYILLYRIVEEKQEVDILAFIYGKRQWQALIGSRLEDDKYAAHEGAFYVNEERASYGSTGSKG